MSQFFADYPVSGGGVTSLNGLTGALTLVGAGGITITPSGSTITITGSGGTVTSVGLALPVSVFTVTGSPVTTSGTLTGSFTNQSANTVFAGPTTGAATTPTFRALVAADIPSLPYANQALSNLTPTSINQSLVPNAPGAFNLGSTADFWTSAFVGTLRDAAGNVAVNVQARLLVDSSSVQQATWSTNGFEVSKALLLDGATSGALTMLAAAVTTSYSITWPAAQATGTQVLSNTGGTLSWVNQSTASAAGPVGAVQYSDGSGGFLADDTDFHWDDTGKLLQIGPSQGAAGTVPFAMTVVRSITDAPAEDGATYMRHNSFSTTNNNALNTALLVEAEGQVDTGVSTAANAGVIFQAYRNNGSSDLGSMQFLVGAFGGAHQIGTGSTATTDLIAGVLAQVDMSSGIANRVADFYGLSGNNSGGTINTGTFGIYIEPPSSGAKDNWLSGHASVGGSTFVASTSALEVAGVFGIRDVASGFQVSFAAPSLVASTPYILPPADGTSGFVLTTDGAGNLSWQASSSGANTFLSNLTSPTAINQDLIFDEGTTATLKTKDDVTTTQSLLIESGTAATAGDTGDVQIITGASAAGASGSIFGVTGTSATSSGSVVFQTGVPAVDNNSGVVNIVTGATSGVGLSGPIGLTTGTSVNGNSGNINLTTGSVSGTGTRGQISFKDGTEGTAGYVWTSTDTTGDGAWMPASSTPVAPTIQQFTSGSGTYTTPASVLYIRIVMVGAGGGGAGSGTAISGGTGGAGGNTTFGTSLLAANGGAGAVTNGGGGIGGGGGSASLGTGPVGIALSGGSGDNPGTTSIVTNVQNSGNGAASFFGGSGFGGTASGAGGAGITNSGAGGGGGGGAISVPPTPGGGAGGYVDAIITTPTATYAYAVGAAGTAGTAGTSGFAGGAGGSGLIVVYEYYQ